MSSDSLSELAAAMAEAPYEAPRTTTPVASRGPFGSEERSVAALMYGSCKMGALGVVVELVAGAHNAGSERHHRL